MSDDIFISFMDRLESEGYFKSPLDKAADVYASEPCARTLGEDIDLHLLNPTAYVIKGFDFFLMGRPVVKEPLFHEMIVDPSKQFYVSVCNCWHVALCTGNVRKAVEAIPYPLPWVCWERKNVLRFYRLDAIKAKLRNERLQSVGSLASSRVPL